jgi:hypothetical protein
MALNSWAKFFASMKAGTRGTVQPATQQVPINHGFGGNSGKGGVQAVPRPKNTGAPAAASAAPATPAPTQQNTYNPTPLVPDARQQQPSLNIMMPEMPAAPPPQYSAGGAGAEVGTNAAGFRRKKSSARMAGLTSKGTSQFKIGGQSARSSGLNIGT